MRTTDTHAFFYTNEFSNWNRCPVKDTRTNTIFPTSEHAFMFLKAEFFGDVDAKLDILLDDHPKAAKEAGRKVRGYNDAEWNLVRYGYMVLVSYWKFSQNPEYLKVLLATKGRHLVEASPYDRIWGIGLGMDSPLLEDPKNWKGLNLLGNALVDVRKILDRAT